MTLLLFALCTFALPGFTCAVVWRRLIGARGPARVRDAVVWLAASTHISAALYYVLLAVAPGRSSEWYRIALPSLCVIVLALSWRATISLMQELRASGRAALRRALGSPARTGAALCLWLLLAVLAVRLGSITLTRPITNHDTLLYATRGWEWHQDHTLGFWQPEAPSKRGFFDPVSHSPSFELLLAWAADWSDSRFADENQRSIALACHLQTALLLATIAAPLGSIGSLFAAGLYLTTPELTEPVIWHLRESFRVTGVLLLLAALLRTWSLPWPLRSLAIGLAGGAALCGHTSNLVAVAVVALAWGVVHARQWRRLMATCALALPIAVAVGGKQYVRNLSMHGHPAGINRTFDAFRTNEARWALYQSPPGQLPRGIAAIDQKLMHLVRPAPYRTEYVLPLSVLLLIASLGLKEHRIRAFCCAAVGVHLAMAAGLLDGLFLPVSTFFGVNTRYRLHMAVIYPLAITSCLYVLHRRPWLRAGGVIAAVIVGAYGYHNVWRATQFQFSTVRFPELHASTGQTTGSGLLEMERVAADSAVLSVSAMELLYYTDLQGMTYRDPRLKPVYEATTSAGQHRELWDAGIRYVAFPGSWGPRLMRWWFDVLGYVDLLADESLCRRVVTADLAYGKRLELYELMPPVDVEAGRFIP